MTLRGKTTLAWERTGGPKKLLPLLPGSSRPNQLVFQGMGEMGAGIRTGGNAPGKMDD